MQKTLFVKSELMKMIRQCKKGVQLLPEAQLADKYNVSLITVRRAVQSLVESGYVEKIQGSGTFVRNRKISSRKMDFTEFQRFLSSLPEKESVHGDETDSFLRFSLCESRKHLDNYDNLLTEFKRQSPSCHVALDNRPLSKGRESYYQEIARGVYPDLFILHCNHMYYFIRNIAIQPLDNYINPDLRRLINNFDPFVKQKINYENKIWMLPRGLYVFTLLYNKDIFDAEGVSYPDENWDWDTYLEVARQLTLKKNGRILRYGALPFRCHNFLSPLVWAFGGDFVNNKGKTLLDRDETYEAIEYAADLTLKHKVTTNPADWDKGSPSQKHNLHIDLFNQGRIAMRLAYNFSQIYNPDLNYGVTLVPRGPAGRFTPGGFSGWAVSSKTDFPEEASRLLTCFAGSAGYKHGICTDLPPFVKGEIIDDFLRSNTCNAATTAFAMKKHLRHYPFNGHFWPYLAPTLQQMLQDVYRGRIKLRNAVKKTNKLLQKAMDEFLKNEEKK